MPDRSLQEITEDLAGNYDSSESGNGIRVNIREHISRGVAERLDEVVTALRASLMLKDKQKSLEP